MKHDLEINTRMLINKWTKFVSFLLVRLKKAEGDRRGQEGARSRSHSTKTKTETESRRSGTVTWRAASEDAVSCEGRGDRSWRRNARTRHTWRVSRQYAFDSDELIRRFWRIAIRILATDTGTVFHLERKKKMLQCIYTMLRNFHWRYSRIRYVPIFRIRFKSDVIKQIEIWKFWNL